MKFQILFSSLFFILSGCGSNGATKPETEKKEVAPAVKTVEFVNSMRLKAPKRGDVFAYGEEIEILVQPKKKLVILIPCNCGAMVNW